MANPFDPGGAGARGVREDGLLTIGCGAGEPRFYPAVAAQLTAECLKASFPRLVRGPVEPYPCSASRSRSTTWRRRRAAR